MIWFDILITFILSLFIVFLLGTVINLMLKTTDPMHWFRTLLVSVAVALLAAFIFTI